MRALTIRIPTPRFEQTACFYRDTLGLAVPFEGDGCCLVHAGPIDLSIQRIAPSDALAPTGHGLVLDLLVQDMPAISQRLQEAGVAIRKWWFDGNFQHLLVADPDGNLLQLAELMGG